MLTSAMVMVFTFGKMVANTMVAGKMDSNMALENISKKMEAFVKVSGKMVSVKNGWIKMKCHSLSHQ